MSKKGVTLVELLGAVIIGAIATALIASIFISFTNILNTIYDSGSANSQGVLISTSLMRELNDFEPSTVTLNAEEDTLFFNAGLNVLAIRKTTVGDVISLSYEIADVETPLELNGYQYQSIDFSLTSSDDGRLKTVVISIQITDGNDIYDFMVSYLVINYT